MKRKDFLKKILLTGIAGIASPKLTKGFDKNSEATNAKISEEKVGYNHLPNQDIETMNTIIHKAETRGRANHGWLDSHHTFSFANYHNPERMNFGVLRVLNDDVVEAGRGFGTHPHDNMEIISIPLEGDLEHKDSMGNIAIIKEGDVQIMSAGTGVTHSEMNRNKDKDVKFLQIWVYPNKRNVSPRYDQISIEKIAKENKFYQIVSPNKDDDGVWLNQDAWFHLGDFKKGNSDEYSIKKNGNGVYAFILDGEVEIDGQILSKRDGIGIWDTDRFNVKALNDTRILLMEVPMSL